MMLNTIGMTLAAGLLALSPAIQQRDVNAAAGKQVTMIGCVERADQVLDTSTTGATVSSLDFVLIKASNASSASGVAGTTGTASTAGAATTPAVGPIYELKAETGKLNPHVGQKVEVSGRLQNTAAASASGDPAKTPAGAIAVDSVRMIASTCPR
jgi:hypothetical protein